MNLIKKQFKAFGLVESLVAMAVFGTAIIMITSLSAKSLRTVKENELADFANSIMVRSMEYVRSDQVDNASFNNYNIDTFSGKIYFKITGDLSDPAALISAYAIDDDPLQQTAFERNLAINNLSNCDGSSYKIDVTGNTEWSKLIICNQLSLEKDASNNFIITSTVVYKGLDDYKVTQMRGYKLAQ